MKKLTIQEILEYEIATHWLSPYIYIDWMQRILGKYIANKVKRKYKLYENYKDFYKKVMATNSK